MHACAYRTGADSEIFRWGGGGGEWVVIIIILNHGGGWQAMKLLVCTGYHGNRFHH